MSKKQSSVPSGLRGLTVALVGAYVTGALYFCAAAVIMGNVAISTPTHGLILLATVVVVSWPARVIMRADDRAEAAIGLEEDRA